MPYLGEGRNAFLEPEDLAYYDAIPGERSSAHSTRVVIVPQLIAQSHRPSTSALTSFLSSEHGRRTQPERTSQNWRGGISGPDEAGLRHCHQRSCQTSPEIINL